MGNCVIKRIVRYYQFTNRLSIKQVVTLDVVISITENKFNFVNLSILLMASNSGACAGQAPLKTASTLEGADGI